MNRRVSKRVCGVFTMSTSEKDERDALLQRMIQYAVYLKSLYQPQYRMKTDRVITIRLKIRGKTLSTIF